MNVKPITREQLLFLPDNAAVWIAPLHPYCHEDMRSVRLRIAWEIKREINDPCGGAWVSNKLMFAEMPDAEDIANARKEYNG